MNSNLNFGPYYEQVSNWILTQTNASQYFAILAVLLVGVLITLIFISDKFKHSRTLFIICSITIIFIFRGLSLYSDLFTPDEGNHLATAITLSHDGRFWVAANTSTAGPAFVILILIVHKIINLFFPSFGITVFLLRLTGIIIISISFILLLKIFESRLNKKIARAISLFFVMFFSFSYIMPFFGLQELPEIQAVNTEFPCMLFITIFLYALYKFKDNNNFISLITAGLALGILPLTKLQTVPICAALILWSFYEILRKEYSLSERRKDKRHYALLVYIGMAALPSILLFLYCLTYENGIENAIFYYILNANAYTGGHNLVSILKYAILNLFPMLLGNPWYNSISIIILAALITSLALFLIKKMEAKINSNYFFSCILVLFSIEAVAHPMRPFAHYIIFLVVPALIFLMETVVLLITVNFKWIKPPKQNIPKKVLEIFRKSNIITFCLLVLTLALFSSFPGLVLRNTVLSIKTGFTGLIGSSNPYSTYTAQLVTELTNKDDYIVVWGFGWLQGIYVYANRKSGTANVDIERLFTTYASYSSKNIDLYISDIKRNKPKLIIDVVARPSVTLSDRETHGLKNHAQVWPAIRDDYTFEGILDFQDGVTFLMYLRNE
jgi:hypothetical protein